MMRTRTKRCWSCALGLLLTLGAAGSAAGQQAPSPAVGSGAEYQELIQKAIREHELGNWPEAKSFFARAHALLPNARTLRGLGMVAYEQRSYVETIGFLRAALSERRRPLTPAMHDQVLKLLEEAQGFVARYRLALQPAEATLAVDGKQPVLDQEGLLLLDPGGHEIVIRAAGHATVTRRITTQGSSRGVLQVDLEPLDADQPAAAPVEAATQTVVAEPETDFFATRTAAQWVGMGGAAAGVAGLATSAVFTVLAGNKNADSMLNCEDNRCNREGLADRDAAAQAGTIATVALIAGAALLASGSVLYFTGGASDDAHDSEAASLQLWPDVRADGLLLSLGGRLP